MAAIKFHTSQADFETIARIADRAVALGQEAGVPVKRLDALMDITAVHANGCPLRLADLLAADRSSFAHDVFGIRRHLDRRTGKLGGCFLPRFAAPAEAARDCEDAIDAISQFRP